MSAVFSTDCAKRSCGGPRREAAGNHVHAGWLAVPGVWLPSRFCAGNSRNSGPLLVTRHVAAPARTVTPSAGSPPMDFAGWGKRVAEMQIHAYKVQYNLTNFSVVIPAHVYGPGDNFDPDTALVIPSLIYKIYRRDNPVLVWGNGEAVRDFVYSRDVAWGVILALYHGTNSRMLNLGSGRGSSIKELVQVLNSFLDFTYQFDASKPAGYPKRVMDISLARELIGYNPQTCLAEGLRQTWDWFVKNPDEYSKKKNYFKED